MAVVASLDPGSGDSGFVVRHNRDLLHAHTVPRGRKGDTTINAVYVAAVRDHLLATFRTLPETPHLLVIEDVVTPSPFIRGKKRTIDPAPFAAQGAVAGAAIAAAGDAKVPVVVVRPSGFGQGDHYAYPKALHDPMGGCRSGTRGARCDPSCTTRGKDGTLTGANRHLRAAWDASFAGPLQLRKVRAR